MSKHTRENQRQFLLSFFDCDQQYYKKYSEIEVNGFWLVKRCDSF